MGRVPVTSRDNEAEQPKNNAPSSRFGLGEVAVVVVFAAVVLIFVRPAAENYVAGRMEISRATEAIAQKEQRVDELDAQLKRYDSEAYRREQARRKLGVIAPGETPYRIVDPHMEGTPEDQAAEDARQERGWLGLMWDSLSVPTEGSGPDQGPIGGGELDTHLPLNELPEEQPAEGQ